MRYSLRNKPKIKAVLGAAKLKQIISDLDSHFKNEVNKDLSGILKTKDFEFIIISRTFDIYNLAFKK